jgi:hypothetical protein
MAGQGSSKAKQPHIAIFESVGIGWR